MCGEGTPNSVVQEGSLHTKTVSQTKYKEIDLESPLSLLFLPLLDQDFKHEAVYIILLCLALILENVSTFWFTT